MNDLISRRAAMDALGERPMVWTSDDYSLGERNQYDIDRLAIETVPSVDAVKVVRCKDCKHGYEGYDGRICLYGHFIYCNVDDDSFCDNGERKDG